MSDWKRPGGFWLVFLGVLVLDQIFKNIFFARGEFAENRRALFGLEIGFAPALAAFFLFSLFLMRGGEKNFSMPLALLFAGIASNLIDRARLGFIVDYVNVFPPFVFNLADAAILCGATILIWRIMKE